jgi:hypothetical protein
MANSGLIVLVVASCLATVFGYNTSLTMCGSPSSATTTSEYECTGALFNLVDINSFNHLKTEAGCVAAMLGVSTQIQGYHCLSTKNCPGAGCMCQLRQGCGSAAAAPASTKSCLYGIQQASECPADVAAPAGGPHSSSAKSLKGSAIMIFMLVVLSYFFNSEASYNTRLTMCGSPSSATTTSEYACTGALFNLVDINSFNHLKTEAGCVAAMLGVSIQIQGYHCLSTKNCPGAGCMCELRQGCGSAAAAPATTKSCVYGIQQASECPADVTAPGPTSSASHHQHSAVVFGAIAVAVYTGAVFSQ